MFPPYSYVVIIWTVVTGIITLWASLDVFLNERIVRRQCPSEEAVNLGLFENPVHSHTQKFTVKAF